MMKPLLRIFSVLLVFMACTQISGAATVGWTADIEKISDHEGVLHLRADIPDGYHIYGLEMPSDGKAIGTPDPTSVQVDSVAGLVLSGPLTCSVEAVNHFDSFQNLNLPWITGKPVFSLPFRTDVSVKGVRIAGTVYYMACTDQSCTPPAKYRFSLDFGTPAPISIQQAVQPVAGEAAAGLPSPSVPGISEETVELWWQPVEMAHETTAQSYWMLLLLGFLGGLVALLTPCVWPMIPMTVSFFLKKSKSRRKSVADAVIYSLSIVSIFLVLGIALTLLFGPGKLNEIATGAVFNVIFFVILVIFAVSFFGAFEITLPARWSTAIDNKAENTTGILSIFFMAFTLVLVSFSCTGPIIGTLLVEAFSQGNIMGPLLGMGGFAVGLALPFGLFAFFPSMLKELPRSGSWLNTVKVVLGFVELILSLKFLSVADLAYGWGILDREVFISIWIVLFVLLGLYLLGKLRFSHDGPSDGKTSVTRFFLSVASFSFAVYLLPGLWGAPLKAVSAFAPPLYTQDFNLYGGEFKEFDDYEEGMRYAAEHGKPVLLDFSGYACVNCRKMEGAVFDTPEVRELIDNGYVMIKLMVDDKKDLPAPVKVEENGEEVILETVGDKWSYLQRHKFGINSQPYYVLLDNRGAMLAPARVYDEDVDSFIAWLEQGLDAYEKTISK